MVLKTKSSLLIALCIIAGGLLLSGMPAISQDYVAPDQAQEEADKPEEKSTSSTAPALETEYEKRLREEIDRQMKAQQAGADEPEPENDTDLDDFAEEDDTPPPPECGTSVASAITAIVKASTEDKAEQVQVGTTLNTLVKNIWKGYDQLPSKLDCGNGGKISGLEDDAKKKFQNEFVKSCLSVSAAAKAALDKGGVAEFNRYIREKMTSLSDSSLIEAKDTACDKAADDDQIADSGDADSMSESGGSSSGGGNEQYPTGGQSYPPGAEPDGHNHDDSPGSISNVEQSLPPVPPNHTDNPPGVTFGPDARTLAVRRVQSPDSYVKCTFSANNAIVTECAKKLDYVFRDVQANIVKSVDRGLYLAISEVCLRGEGKGCKESDTDYILINSGYRSPATNAAVGGVRGSQHLQVKAADLKIPNMDKEKVVRVCNQLGTGGCGIYKSGANHMDKGGRRCWDWRNSDKKCKANLF